MNPARAWIMPHVERSVHAARNPIEQTKTVSRIDTLARALSVYYRTWEKPLRNRKGQALRPTPMRLGASRVEGGKADAEDQVSSSTLATVHSGSCRRAVQG